MHASEIIHKFICTIHVDMHSQARMYMKEVRKYSPENVPLAKMQKEIFPVFII